MTRSREQGENEVTRRAREEAVRTGRDVCDILREMLRQAQATGDIVQMGKVRRAQKYLGCRKCSQAEEEAMTWYAAHLVMLIRLKNRSQRRIPAWENIVLVSGATDDAALARAEAIGRASEGDDDGSFTWGGHEAKWEFAGVRKLTECDLARARPENGDEITYAELEFNSLRDAKRYANGNAVTARHVDQIEVAKKSELLLQEAPKKKRA